MTDWLTDWLNDAFSQNLELLLDQRILRIATVPRSGLFTPWPNRPWPPLWPKNVFLTYKKLGKLGIAPLCESLTDLRRLPPPPARSHRTSPTTPPRSHRTSPTTPLSKSQNLADYPPRSHRTSPTTPPSKSQNIADYPPPLEVTEPRRLPPRSHRTSPTTLPLEVTEPRRLPPSKSQNLADYPRRKFLGPPFLNF